MAKVQKGEQTHHKPRALPIRYVIAFFVFLAFLMLGAVTAYGFLYGHWYHQPMLAVARVIPIPAAKVDDQTVRYRDVAELALVAEWQEREGPFEEAMDTMIDRALMKQLAHEIGTGVSQEDLEAYKIDQEEIQDLLGEMNWTIEDYREYVVEPLLLYQAVDREIVNSREYQTIALAEMESIVENIELGVSFTDLAVQYSEHESSILGGDLGYVERDDFADGMEDIFDLEVGEVTDILEWENYFVVAEVYDVLEEEGERTMVGVRMIAIEKDDLSVIFDEYKKDADIQFLLR